MDISPELAALAAVSNPQTAQAGTAFSPELMQLFQAAGGTAANGGQTTTNADAAALYGPRPGVARRTASLNVPMTPATIPLGPPPTPNAPGPQGPPPTPNVAGPQGPPPTPNAPQGVPQTLPPNRLIDPSRVMRPAGDDLAAAGRKGDTMVAHVTPGDTVVPQQMLAHPGVRKSLHAAFVANGASPGAFQVGNPTNSINPATGLPEFGFDLGSLLPIALGIGGSIVAPPLLPALGAFAPIIGGGLGSTVGSIATGVDPLKAAAMGFGGAAVGGAVGSMFPGGALTSAAGETPAMGAAVGAPAIGSADAGIGAAAGDAVKDATLPTLAGKAATAATATQGAGSSGLNDIISKLTNGKGILGAATSGLASMAASNVIGGLFPDKAAAPVPTDNGPQLPTLAALKAKYARTYNLPNYTTGNSNAADRTFFTYPPAA